MLHNLISHINSHPLSFLINEERELNHQGYALAAVTHNCTT